MKKALLVVFVFLMISDAHARNELEKKSLRGLPRFYILIETLDKAAEGITVTTLRTDVEIRLRKAGISIFEQDKAPNGAPWLT